MFVAWHLKVSKVENNSKNYVNLYHLIKSNVMPAATMFSKFKSGNQAPQNPIEANPITQYFEIGKPVACAGPELVWKIHDAYRKADGKVGWDVWPQEARTGHSNLDFFIFFFDVVIVVVVVR